MSEQATWQESLDASYHRTGPCCAGCDWWRSWSPKKGDCTRSAPVSGHDRMMGFGIQWSSLAFDPGHAVTDRTFSCGEFKDEFDWSSLPLPYRRRIGAPL